MTVGRTVHARASLAGNPSDGFGGAVCAVLVPHMSTTVRVVASERGSSIDLIRAVIERFEAWSGDEVQVGLEFSTTIPRSVGLAGSSAITIASIQALAEHTGHDLAVDDVAELAHTIERQDLGIAGGWQDQLVQSHGASSIMDFADGRTIRPLARSHERSIPLYVAWSVDAAEVSGATHAALRRGDAPDPDLIDELRSQAHAAATAIEARSVHDLKSAVDRTFDLRTEMMPVASPHREMVETARSCGACANLAGSGGAIVGVVPKRADEFVDHIERAGLQITTWEYT